MIVRGPLRGHNDTPCGRPNLSRPAGWPLFVFRFYQLLILFLNIVRLIMESTFGSSIPSSVESFIIFFKRDAKATVEWILVLLIFLTQRQLYCRRLP
jgi:hypothetical protein